MQVNRGVLAVLDDVPALVEVRAGMRDDYATGDLGQRRNPFYAPAMTIYVTESRRVDGRRILQARSEIQRPTKMALAKAVGSSPAPRRRRALG
jgi:hypothetical protein